MAVAEYHEDIFTVPSQTLVNPVNIHGAMGKGLALQFKQRVPGLYERYRALCLKRRFGIHQLWRYPWPETDKQILCFPTKWHWKNPSRLEDIVKNLKTLAANYERLGITSLAIPPVGCGLGGLSYEDQVREHMLTILDPLPIDVRIVLWSRKNESPNHS